MSDDRLGLPSASAMPRIDACPASWNLSRGVTPVRTKQMIEWGEAGERIHLWLQLPDFIDIDPEELDVAEQCVGQRELLMHECFGNADGIRTFKEQRLWLTERRRKICSGQMDFGAFHDRTGLIVDYKTSYGDTLDSSGNLQIRTNLVTLDEFMRGQGLTMDVAYGAIIQPLVSKRPEKVRYTREHLDSARDQIIDIVERAERPDAPFHAGPHCRTCPAILICQAAKREEDKLLAADITKDPKTKEIRLAGLTTAEMGPLLEAWKIAKVRGENLEAAAKLALKQDSTAVPGWKLGDPAEMRIPTDVEGFFLALQEADLIDEATFIKQCVKIHLGNTQDALKQFNHMKSKKEAQATLDATCAPWIRRTFKEPSLERVEPDPETPFS